jgi:LacI family gluconate utilization system Gnt-I transcriptional repressor
MADDQRALSRRRGFTDALRERGLEVASEVIVRAPSTLGMARDGLRRLLAADAAIDGVFCSSDQLAMGVLYEASARAIAVPERLAVVGFGNLGASAYSHPALTTVAVDGDRVGREAARLILERLAGKAARPKPTARVIDVGSRVIARESA